MNHQKHEEAKAEKLRKHMEYKEKMDLAAELTKRDVSKANKSIASLTKQVGKLSLELQKMKGNARGTPSKGKPTKGVPKKNVPAKSTGAMKNSGGKRKNTAKGKASAGKNGKQ
jgi:hypothetical protein